jgi:hypothetical protein
MIDFRPLQRIAEDEFADIVQSTTVIRSKLRVLLRDGSYIDFWWSLTISGRYAYHWERTHVDGTVYRHDNMPDPDASKVKTFPQHFHDGISGTVTESYISAQPQEGLRQFLHFAREHLSSSG